MKVANHLREGSQSSIDTSDSKTRKDIITQLIEQYRKKRPMSDMIQIP
jgi:hypothetical protein